MAIEFHGKVQERKRNMSHKRVPTRQEVPAEHTWSLTPLFASDADWENLYKQVESRLDGYSTYIGRLHESGAVLKEAIEFHLTLSRQIERLYTYAHLKSDQDKSNQLYMGLHQRALTLVTRAAESASYISPEIQSIPEAMLRPFLEQEGLKEYLFFLHKILRTKPHTLDQQVERVLAMSRELSMASSEVFGQLDNVDLRFGTITDAAGNEIELSHGNLITFLNSPDRDIRRRAFFQYYRAYDEHKHTLAATLTHSARKDLFYSRVRNFASCRSAALFPDDVPEAVYDNLIDTVRASLKPLFSYLNFRKQVLALDELHMYDTYVPIIGEVEFHMPYEQAVEICIQALAPLGSEYTRTLHDGLLGGWVDRYENRGKRSGAYSSGCYDSPPYILLNYTDTDINSLYALIHEAGHSMHSHYARTHQPYVDHEYTIFVAEVASTFNEILLSQHLLRHYRDDPRMQAYVLTREIDNLRGTLFRQTMFAEFEKFTHDTLEANHPLTLETIVGFYRELLSVYFGDTTIIDEELTLECLRIPHFYSAFYVYKYATGVSAAVAVADRVLKQGAPASNAYLDFLKLGGSRFPMDELLAAGVDMRTPQPIQRTIDHFAGLVDQLIEVHSQFQPRRNP
jgi:oligoendopeptidase F